MAHPPPKPSSPGITFAAVVVFLGSAFCLLMCFLMVLGVFQLRRLAASSAPPLAAQNVVGPLAMAILFYLGFAAWGFTTGIGLLKLKSWARASLLVFSVLALLGAISSIAALSLIGPSLPAAHGGPPPPQVLMVVTAIMSVPAVVAIWWLVFFNLRGVRAQFAEYPSTGHYSAVDGSANTLFLGPQRPLAITLIAVFYLMSVPGLAVVAFGRFPAMLLNWWITGPAAKTIYIIYLAVYLYMGIGLLKLKPPARWLAIGLSVLHLASGAWLVLRPGFEERLQALFDGLNVRLPPGFTVAKMMPLIRAATAVGFLLPIAILWVLVRAKEAFTAQGRRTSA